jgi:hypothetical protein
VIHPYPEPLDLSALKLSLEMTDLQRQTHAKYMGLSVVIRLGAQLGLPEKDEE